jgi:hypothetical protein
MLNTLAYYYCEQTLSEDQPSFKSVFSMMPLVQIDFLLYQIEAGKNRVGSKQKREKERQRQMD